MKQRKKKSGTLLSQAEIDKVVESLADDDSAWEPPIEVRRVKPAPLTLPAELAARAAFLAKLHKEKSIEAWLTRVIKERVEMEEVAFTEAKREMFLRNGA